MSRTAAQKRAFLAAKYGWKCHWCKEPLTPETATLEHLWPQSLGGRSGGKDLTNLRLACVRCNNERGSDTKRIPKKTQEPPRARSPIRDACVVCGTESRDSLYCEGCRVS